MILYQYLHSPLKNTSSLIVVILNKIVITPRVGKDDFIKTLLDLVFLYSL